MLWGGSVLGDTRPDNVILGVAEGRRVNTDCGFRDGINLA
jgi:hypothetical protein